jgi:hypothetical protein
VSNSLVHELWRDIDGTMVCLAGPDGDSARKLLGASSKLEWVFEAASHFEAMSRYYARMNWGEYTTDQPWDREPYPVERVERQRETRADWRRFHIAMLDRKC